MGSYIDSTWNYQEGDFQYGDIEVPIRPSSQYSWDGGNWVVTTTAKLVAIEAKKSAIRDFRDNLLSLTPFNGKVFQSDLKSKIQIMVVASQPTMPSSATPWRCADNTYQIMTLTLFQQLMITIMAREGAAYKNSSAHQDAVAALTDYDAIINYDYSTGWPT